MDTNSLLYRYKSASIVTKLIVINAIVFLLARLVSFLFQFTGLGFIYWFALPKSLELLIVQPWSLVTYSFIHFGFWHILMNMLMLYWFGSYVLNLFSERRFLSIYILGGIAGGLFYVVSFNVFPVFSNASGFLIGASAAVRAIMIFIAAYTPNTKMRVFTFDIKLWHLGAFFVLLDMLQLTSSGNPGGMIAHLGGALFGYVFAVQLKKGNDLGRGFEAMMDWVANLVKPAKKKPFKKVYRTTQRTSSRSNKQEFNTDTQKKIDAILDKIAKSGYDSLTKAEKEFLFKAGEDMPSW